ncbi:PREDICTED: uncharacterized protein LOC107069384 [Polistes dominula]|uniref:Uncharacterized protein LOC107069384 n=1 Tax=Polistes dominula TaxID=743375 RepID=A0ABM1IPK9_POLDO|nr:PREDICTED: uncharacterized protein LOC107069384 [Polistes dominula]
MAIPSEKMDPLREQTEKDGGTVKKEDEIQKPKEDMKNDSDRGRKKKRMNYVLVKDKGVQTLTMPIIKKKRKCTNCCGGLPGCGPGLGQGCDGKCSCVPGIEITSNGLYDEDEFNLSRKLFPRFYVTRNRLRGGGGGGRNLRKNVMAKIRSRRKKNRVFQVVSSLGRPKEDLLCRGFVRSLSSLRGQRMGWWLEKAQESCWESCCLLGKNCVGRVSVSAECVPSSYNNYVSYVVPGVPERHRRRRRRRQNFQLEQNIMADGSTSITTNVSRKFQRETTTSTTLLLSNTSKYHGENNRKNRRLRKFDIPKKTISNIYCPMKNCSHLFSYNTKRVERTKTYKDCNFSKGILPCKNSSSYETLNIVERLRGGGNEYPWSDNVINEDVLRFQEEQDHYDDDGGDGGGGGGSENQNEDGRIRGAYTWFVLYTRTTTNFL